MLINITDEYPNTVNQKEMMKILGTILEQNYFQYNQKYYKQPKGLAMGAPTSAKLAETRIRHMEHKQLYPVLLK
jgi:hypothetical protein